MVIMAWRLGGPKNTPVLLRLSPSRACVAKLSRGARRWWGSRESRSPEPGLVPCCPDQYLPAWALGAPMGAWVVAACKVLGLWALEGAVVESRQRAAALRSCPRMPPVHPQPPPSPAQPALARSLPPALPFPSPRAPGARGFTPSFSNPAPALPPPPCRFLPLRAPPRRPVAPDPRPGPLRGRAPPARSGGGAGMGAAGGAGGAGG